MRKKIVSLFLAVAMMTGSALSTAAYTEQQLREEKAWTEAQLDATYNQIDQLYYYKEQLAGAMETLNTNIVNCMVSIEVLEVDIENKTVQIENTQKDIQKATKAEENQYNAMKQRIQYLYEKGGDDAWFEMILAAEDLSDLLTRAEYTQKMYEQDRKLLDKYVNTIEQVKKLKDQYAEEQSQLEELKGEYEVQKGVLEGQLAEVRAEDANCDAEIEWAQYQATEYANLLSWYTTEIDRMEAERIAAEEAARAAAAAQAAQATETMNEMIESGEIIVDDEGNVYTLNDGSEESTGSSYAYNEDGELVEVASTSASTATYSSTGSTVADYALQFVGNPYVWGGTSLTSGADCSGFVQSVYANFGISLPRTSYEQETAGYEVSYSEAQPGDLICYGSHVAIYLGDGKIVHASNSTDGIKISDDATYRTITSVRRLV